jgi:dihydrofolate reductase
MVIGGGSIYDQLLPYCTAAYITKVHTTLPCDTFLRDLDRDPDWELQQILTEGTENGISYQICRYHRIK